MTFARADEAVQVAAARLAEVLHLDAPVRVVPVEQQVAPIELVSMEPTVQQMVSIGLSSRPEVGESSQLVAAACERLKREQYAPFTAERAARYELRRLRRWAGRQHQQF